MKMRIFSTAVAIAIAFTACKKNVSDDVTISSGDPAVLKAQAWFEKETSKASASKVPVTGQLSFTNDAPQWNKAVRSSTNRMVIPVTIGEMSASVNKATKYLVLTTDVSGNITEGHYAYVLGSKADAPSVLTAITIPSDFTGAIVEYGIDGTFRSSQHYSNGTASASQDKISTTPMQGRDGGGGTTNSVPSCEGGQVNCIDWYWQTYQNGVLIYEEYLYTTCHCEGANTGGGSGGPASPCDLSCEQVDDLLENITITKLHAVTHEGGPEYTDGAGVIRKPWNEKWKFLTLTLFPGYSPEYTAYFNGVLFRQNAAATKWKWEFFTYSNNAWTGGNIPPCMDVTVTISVSTAISADKLIANAALSGQAEAKVPCLNGIRAGKHPINDLFQPFGTPPVLLGED